MTKSVDVQQFESNGEVFEIGSYHGISILIRKSDGFVNATKLCNQFEKDIRQIIRTSSWKEFYQVFCEEFGTRVDLHGFIYELAEGYTKKCAGQYFHPKLINYIIFRSSPKYAIYVSKIMDLLNERIQITNEDQNELIKNLQREIKKLKKLVEQHERTIDNQDEYIEEQLERIHAKDEQLHSKSVRASKDVARDLYISVVDKTKLQLCANSHDRPRNILNHLEFPSSMHIKKEVSNKLDIKYPYEFPSSMYHTVVK